MIYRVSFDEDNVATAKADNPAFHYDAEAAAAIETARWWFRKKNLETAGHSCEIEVSVVFKGVLS